MGKTCLKMFITGMILFVVGGAGLAALDINGYDIDEFGTRTAESTIAVDEGAVVENGTGGHIFKVNENDVTKLDVKVNMENFNVIEGDTFEVVGYNIDPEYLNCTVTDGCLYVSYSPKAKLFNIYYDNIAIGNITVHVPPKVLESADFTVKAGSLTVTDIDVKTLSLNMTAGDTFFSGVSVQERSQIKMTAGSSTFELCNFNNSNNINMTAGDMIYNECRLLGDSDIKMTAGDLFMNLIGRRSDYNIKVDRTAGDVYIDGYEYGSDYAVTTMVTTVYQEEAYAEEHADGIHEESLHEEHVKNNLNVKITAGNCSISFNENE